LPTAQLWVDYLSIPQPGMEPEKPNMLRSKRTSDHRYSAKYDTNSDQAKLADQLTQAVNSIPAYVEMSSLLLVLVPAGMHFDRKEPCGFPSWRSRGWCRMELQTALLTVSETRILVCNGPEATPYFLYTSDAWRLTAGGGQFTCCRNKHLVNGRRITCDKARIHRILSILLDSKDHFLTKLGRLDEARHFACMRQWFLRDLLPSESPLLHQGNIYEQSSFPALCNMLEWDHPDDVIGPSGRTLLHYAVLANDVGAVRELLARNTDALDIVMQDPDVSVGERAEVPLLTAVAFAGFEVVEALLDAKANPHLDYDVLLRAAQFNRSDIVHAWLRRFPDWDLEKRDMKYGSTSLLQFLYFLVDDNASMEVVREMLTRLGDRPVQNYFGMGMLHSLCFNNNSVPHIVKFLFDTNIDVNMTMQPSTDEWRARYMSSQSAIRDGNLDGEVTRELARWEGSTALMLAARHGKVAEVCALVEARADPSLRNGMGQNALEMVEDMFGGAAPTELTMLLEGGGKSRCATW